MDKRSSTQLTKYCELKEKLSSIISAEMKRHKITGVSIAVNDDGKTVWSEGFGYSDKEERIAATPHTVYRIGSITKVFTATAIMQLVEHGLLDLDKPVSDYLPEFTINTRFTQSKSITIRDLMTHHSGLPSDNLNGFYTRSAYEMPERFSSALDYLKNAYTSYSNGLVYSYSNLGISLLGIVVERITGMKYEDYIENNICKPLGMNQTSFEYSPGKDRLLSKGYNKGKGEYEVQMRDLPAGGLQSTALDMSKFLSFTLGLGISDNGNVLKHETLSKMFEVQNMDNPIDFNFKTGLNWILSWPSLEYAGKVAWHDGGSIHYTSLLAIMPDYGFGVTVLTNSVRGAHLNHRVTDEALKYLVLLKNGIVVPETNIPFDIVITEKQSKEVIGKYATISGLVEITNKNQILKTKMNGRLLRMVPQNDGWFSLQLLLFGLIPIKLKQLNNIRIAVRKTNLDRIMGIEQTIGQNKFAQVMGMEYSPTPTPTPQTWINAAGGYKAKKDNQFLNAFELVNSNGMLSLKASVRKLKSINFILKPISNSEAVIQGLGRFAGETVILKEREGVVIINISGLDFVKWTPKG